MTDKTRKILETVELAARRTASTHGANGTVLSEAISDAFIDFANDIAFLIKSHKDEE